MISDNVWLQNICWKQERIRKTCKVKKKSAEKVLRAGNNIIK